MLVEKLLKGEKVIGEKAIMLTGRDGETIACFKLYNSDLPWLEVPNDLSLQDAQLLRGWLNKMLGD